MPLMDDLEPDDPAAQGCAILFWFLMTILVGFTVYGFISGDAFIPDATQGTHKITVREVAK